MGGKKKNLSCDFEILCICLLFFSVLDLILLWTFWKNTEILGYKFWLEF